MQESLHDYMRVGIVHFMIFPELIGGSGEFLNTLTTLVSDPLFDVMEVGMVLDPTIVPKMSSILRQARVEPVYDGQPWTLVPGLDLAAENDADRASAIAAMKNAINQGAQLGSKTCGVMSGKMPPESQRSAAIARLVESLQELCAFAAPLGITLCLEHFDSIPYSKDCLIGSSVEAVKLSEAVRKKTPNYGILLDLSHLPILGEKPADAVRTVRDHLVRTQIGNCSTDPYSTWYGDVHPWFGAPRTNVGIADLAEFLRALLEIGFLSKSNRGIVGFEIKTLTGESVPAILAGSRRALTRAWELV
jgi:sugar phosphate isomerase/epimerase